jgi:hypothetical protein
LELEVCQMVIHMLSENSTVIVLRSISGIGYSLAYLDLISSDLLEPLDIRMDILYKHLLRRSRVRLDFLNRKTQ